ncbi:site-specific DNA-methyltransferase [Thioalkalivibrio sp. XN279]|uniref:site-specific DNA-methyltransferase n=1 Tax=Thioalkalivibrio sp. XN279 TaxID=2714953 RepID=UPI00140C0F2C|nr:site-specific DNA-methyltransferase [Thioalkalivibrio sp. XN279]NHA14595.1 site-specific DNA-methyltransferase [Thioalkalivibrio sp. XN279]
MSKNTSAQETLQLSTSDGGTTNVEKYEFEPIKGYPMLNWRGKRPFTSTQYYPAQLKEVHGEEADGWRNKIFWGDNLQVMSHLLKEFRGQVDLVYIDPPFDSGADYRRTIKVRGKSTASDYVSFEDKQYGDIWTNDEYLQFMYERFILLRELLSGTGSIYVHCDYRRAHYLKIALDEVFGASNFQNEIVWRRTTARSGSGAYNHIHDTIFFYTKTPTFSWDQQYTPYSKEYLESNFKPDDSGRLYRESPITAPGLRSGESGATWKGLNPGSIGKGRHWAVPSFLEHLLSDDAKKSPLKALDELEAKGRIRWAKDGQGRPNAIQYSDDMPGVELQSIWTDFVALSSNSTESEDYPTQKPEELLARIIKSSSAVGATVLDCFMGSGTTQAVAMKLGRRFIGADINLGAIQTTTKRLIGVADGLRQKALGGATKQFTGFELYNVNHYDIFHNPVQAKELLIEALEVQKLEFSTVFDGEKDGRMVKIMPVNRIATRADLNELIHNFDQKAWQHRHNENPNRSVEKITLVCMGHEPDLAAQLELAAKPFKIDVEVVDILRDKADLEFKRDSEAMVAIKKGELRIEKFYPMNLLQKLSLQKESVEDWKELVEAVLIDWNYDGAVLQPAVVDIPGKNALVKGAYTVPQDAGTIRVKITDLLSESWEGSVSHDD